MCQSQSGTCDSGADDDYVSLDAYTTKITKKLHYEDRCVYCEGQG